MKQLFIGKMEIVPYRMKISFRLAGSLKAIPAPVDNLIDVPPAGGITY